MFFPSEFDTVAFYLFFFEVSMAFSPDAGGFKDQQRDESFELKKTQFVGWFNTQNSMSLSEYVMTLNL